jgi:hypothetical protein
MLPTVADMIGMYYNAQLYFIKMGFANIFAWADLELRSSRFQLPV